MGGESGPRARPCEIDWVADIVAQCQTRSVAVFVKQKGSMIALERGWKHSKGGDMAEWPASCQVREYPA